jgi:hypothetical protein
MGLIGRWEPADMYEEIWKLWNEGLRPVTIAALLGVTLQEVYDTLDDRDSAVEMEVYDEDLM